jgi:hypothetical protein
MQLVLFVHYWCRLAKVWYMKSCSDTSFIGIRQTTETNVLVYNICSTNAQKYSLNYVIIKADHSLGAPNWEKTLKESRGYIILPQLHLYPIAFQEISFGRTLNWLRNYVKKLSFLSCTDQQANAIQDLLISLLSEYSLPYRAANSVRGHRPIERPIIYIRQYRQALRCRAVFEATVTALGRPKTCHSPDTLAQKCLSLLHAFFDTITTETHACIGDEASKVRIGVKKKRIFNHKTQRLINVLTLLLSKSSGWTQESDWPTTDRIEFAVLTVKHSWGKEPQATKFFGNNKFT